MVSSEDEKRMYICPMCRKNLGPALEMLGAEVLTIHRQAHVATAIERLLANSKDWPELEEYFQPVRRALALPMAGRCASI